MYQRWYYIKPERGGFKCKTVQENESNNNWEEYITELEEEIITNQIITATLILLTVVLSLQICF